MTSRHILLLTLAEALALGAMGAMLYRALSASPAPVAQGQEWPARLVVMHVGVPRGRCARTGPTPHMLARRSRPGAWASLEDGSRRCASS